jgi:hypothetical protein
MTTENLIVKLQGDTSSLDKSLSKTNKNLNETSKVTKKADNSLIKFEKSTKTVDVGLFGLSKAAIAVGAALTTMITLSAKGEQELQSLSKQTKLATGDFEALAFATRQYGITAEQIADISKDLSDKLGEFASVGTGAFQDFADVTGKTTEEAQALAAEWQDLSSQQVIQNIANELEAAGASANETTFVFEALGSDLSRLTPLFAENGKELQTLTSRYNEANAALSITQAEAEGLLDAATSFDLLTESLGNATKLIAAQLAPALNEFFNGVIDVVPGATQVIVDFINTFRNAENIENVDSLNRLIDEQAVKVEELTRKRDEYVGKSNGYISAEQDEIANKARINAELQEEIQRQEELIQQRDKALEQQQKIADAAKGQGGAIGATVGTVSTQDADAELQALLDRFKTEEQLLLEKYEKEREIAAGNNELLLQLEQEYLAASQELKDEAAARDQERLDEQNAYYADILKQQGQIDKENVDAIEKGNKDKSKSEEAYLDAAITTGNALFEDNKAVKAGLVVVDTAAGISKAFAELPYPAALAASASIAATGVAQLAAIQSASKGGGSASTSVPAEQVDDTPPTLQAQNTDLSNANQTFTIEFSEDGDLGELGAFLNRSIGVAKQNGLT